MGWPFPMLKYKYIFQIKYTEAILSNSTRKLLWCEVTKMLTKLIYCVIYYNFRHLSFRMKIETQHETFHAVSSAVSTRSGLPN